jgi:hypothetical protein
MHSPGRDRPVKKLPFFSLSTHMMVIDFLCGCGEKWSGHDHDVGRGEFHGGGHARSGCQRFVFAGYIYEQAKIDQESIREAPRIESHEVLDERAKPAHT